MSNRFVGRIILTAALLLLYAGESRADVDCNSIVACAWPTDWSPGHYNPAFQMAITGSFSLEADLFIDANCSSVYFSGPVDGVQYGLVTFEYALETMMNPGDSSSWKIRVAGCPETACLTAVAGADDCPR